MCTLTWLRGNAGYELFFNRDEKLTRGRALAPRIHERAGRRWIAPTDTDGGGTWIGVNEFGLSIALLNGYRSADEDQRRWSSRGTLVDALLDALGAREVAVRLRKRDLGRFRSFTLLAIGPQAPALLATWDGAELAIDAREEGHPPICSSSLDASGATRSRRELFTRMQAGHGGLDAELFERFHASHEPARGSASPCMHRDDARTQSYTRIRVGARQVELHYSPAPPCERVPSEVLVLERGSRAVQRA